MKPVFLSAGIPFPRPGRVILPKYSETADLVAIREAIRALTAAVLPYGRLVFGGHPAITPLVLEIAKSLDRVANVMIFQSEYFIDVMPDEARSFPGLVMTRRAPGRDESGSLRIMREQMLATESDYCAGVFIGGMEGVEEEFALFRGKFPAKPVYPIGSTGAAAALLFEQVAESFSESVAVLLRENLAYSAVFRRLLAQENALKGGLDG